MEKTGREGLAAILALLLLGGAWVLVMLPAQPAAAEPTGATILNPVTETMNVTPPDSRTDERGTITTMDLNVRQRIGYWKGYVGNVSGVLTLDDGDGYSIYQWSLIGVSMNGRIFATRTDTVNFTSVECANTTSISDEEEFHNMTASAVYSISRTFNETNHAGFSVGGVPIVESDCYSAFTYVNNAPQAAPNETSPFQEILLQDGSANMIYTTIIVNGEQGFDTEDYDFQLILPESGVKETPTTYYFYLEID